MFVHVTPVPMSAVVTFVVQTFASHSLEQAPDSLHVASIGNVLDKQGDLKGALKHDRPALTIQQARAPGSLNMTTTLNNISTRIQATGALLQGLDELVQLLDKSFKHFKSVMASHLDESLSKQWNKLVANRFSVKEKTHIFAAAHSVRVEESKVIVQSADTVSDLKDVINFIDTNQIKQELIAMIHECKDLSTHQQQFLCYFNQHRDDKRSRVADLSLGLLGAARLITSIALWRAVPAALFAVVAGGGAAGSVVRAATAATIGGVAVSVGSQMLRIGKAHEKLEGLQLHLKKEQMSIIGIINDLETSGMQVPQETHPNMQLQNLKRVFMQRLDHLHRLCRRLLSDL